MTTASQVDFTRTRWSMVSGRDVRDACQMRIALSGLAMRYWFPAYAYVRTSGHAPAVAQDITQAFFQQLLRPPAVDHVPACGSFRIWLLAALRAFLEHDWRELAGGEVVVTAPEPATLERRYQRDCDAASSPERAFQIGFAMEVLTRGCRALRAEAHGAGHQEMFEELRPFLACDPAPAQFAAMQQHTRDPPPAMTIALACLRLRLRELVRTELADTVGSCDAMLGEQRALCAVLRGTG